MQKTIFSDKVKCAHYRDWIVMLNIVCKIRKKYIFSLNFNKWKKRNFMRGKKHTNMNINFYAFNANFPYYFLYIKTHNIFHKNILHRAFENYWILHIFWYTLCRRCPLILRTCGYLTSFAFLKYFTKINDESDLIFLHKFFKTFDKLTPKFLKNRQEWKRNWNKKSQMKKPKFRFKLTPWNLQITHIKIKNIS